MVCSGKTGFLAKYIIRKFTILHRSQYSTDSLLLHTVRKVSSRSFQPYIEVPELWSIFISYDELKKAGFYLLTYLTIPARHGITRLAGLVCTLSGVLSGVQLGGGQAAYIMTLFIDFWNYGWLVLRVISSIVVP